MSKRKRVDQEWSVKVPKKPRLHYNYDLSQLSDELVLKVLSNLPIPDLANCQRLSRRLQRLAGDPEIWKEKYYARWVRPRALRIPGLKDTASSLHAFRYSSKLAKWLEDGHLVQQGRKTDWGRQYRLRDNWWRGHCRIREVEVGAPPAPPVLVKIHRGVIVTADAERGLRAWTMKTDPFLIAGLSFVLQADQTHPAKNCPTSLGINARVSETINVYVGFKDGSFAIYGLDGVQLSLRYAHPCSSNGALIGIAAYHTYVLTMSERGVFSMYRFMSNMEGLGPLPAPRLSVSLKSSNVVLPISLSIRPTSRNLVATIAYSFSRLGYGWSLGLQELRMTKTGEALDSRLTSSLEETTTSFQSIKNQDATIMSRSATSQPFVLHPQSMARPTAISYSHPYLLASLPDNTLMTHLVTSDAENLVISPGRRLWGHTSSVSGVQVSDRGKAVSVSTRGGEIRVWELEDMLSSSSSSSWNQRSSICIRPDPRHQSKSIMNDPSFSIRRDKINCRGDAMLPFHSDLHLQERRQRIWVDFDDEQVVVLDHDDCYNDLDGQSNDASSRRSTRQILSCYDFT